MKQVKDNVVSLIIDPNEAGCLNGIDSFFSILERHLFLGIALFLWEIVLFILMCIDSTPEENQYGKSPKYVEMETNTSATTETQE